jgi:adrenodoxin-NADP+ reductase
METLLMETSLAFRSIGYKSDMIAGMRDLGIDFDESRGIIPNDSHGRIIGLSTGGVGIPGMYCSGWVKQGPAGVIANTMEDAFGTAEAIARDWNDRQPFMAGGQGWDALKQESGQRNLRSVSWDEWKMIDVAEKRRGSVNGKEREKFTSIEEMLEVLA